MAFPAARTQAERGEEGAKERFERLNKMYPSIERPFARRHPISGKVALMADRAYASHVVGMSREESLELIKRTTQLCYVPEYQLRLGWRNEGDVVIFDNYALKHRVIADFYDIPPRSRHLENIGTKGYPCAHDVLTPGVELNEGSRTATGQAAREKQTLEIPKEQNSRARALARL